MIQSKVFFLEVMVAHMRVFAHPCSVQFREAHEKLHFLSRSQSRERRHDLSLVSQYLYERAGLEFVSLHFETPTALTTCKRPRSKPY